MKTYTCSHKAQYYETDQMGIIHHSNYIRWFEEARISLLEAIGYPYDRMEAEGILSPVLEVSCQYRSMVHFGDTVEITASVKSFNGIKLAIQYEVHDKSTGKLRTTGESSHCFLDKEGNLLSLKRSHPDIYQVLKQCND